MVLTVRNVPYSFDSGAQVGERQAGRTHDAKVVRSRVDGCLPQALLLLLYSRTGPRRALSLKLSDTRVYEPEKRTRLGRNRELCTLLPQAQHANSGTPGEATLQGYLAHTKQLLLRTLQ